MTSAPSRIDLNGVVSTVSDLPLISHVPSCDELSQPGAQAVSALEKNLGPSVLYVPQ